MVMSRYVVSLTKSVNFHPETETEEILQNIRTILATRIGTVPLHRALGITWEHIDKPYPVAKAMMMVAVIEAIQAYEPRAKVESVEFEETTDNVMEGLLKPRVTVSIGEV